MKISVRTSATKSSAMELFEQLLKMEGDQLLISSGYITDLDQLPHREIAQSISVIAFASGYWANSDKHSLEKVVGNAKKFALKLQREARALKIKAPRFIFYTDKQWHAKVALKRRSDQGTIIGTVSAAIIGSSNLSFSALSENADRPNHEVDVLITEKDGLDAKEQLEYLFKKLGGSFEGKDMDLSSPLDPSALLAAPNAATTTSNSDTADYLAAQVLMTLTSKFHKLNDVAIDFGADAFDAERLSEEPAATLEEGLDCAKILLAGWAGCVLSKRDSKKNGQIAAVAAEICNADLAYAENVLGYWRVRLLRDELLEAAVAKLNIHRNAWQEVSNLISSRMDDQTSLTRIEVEALPTVQKLLAPNWVAKAKLKMRSSNSNDHGSQPVDPPY